MITVRFPTGFSVQYNDGNYVARFSEFSDIYTKKDGQWIAQVPNSAIIEVQAPCRTYNPIDHNAELASRIGSIERSLLALAKGVKK